VTQLDPVLEALLAEVPAPDTSVSISELRAQAETGAIQLGAGAPAVHEITDVAAPGPSADVALRIYRPRDEPGLPVLVFIHGGGWVAGTLNAIDPTARRLCRGLDCVVVTVTYRLAPEHPFPAAFEDALAATRWVLDNIGNHGGDPKRVTIGGDSAGGNLAAAVTGALHHVGDDRLAAQLLLYPALDLDPEEDPTASWRSDADPTLPVATVRWCIDSYLQGGLPGDPRISPARQTDLSGLPPAVVAIAPADPMYDAACTYVARLQAAGVHAELEDCVGLTHGFANFVDLVPAAAAALERTLDRVRLLQSHPVRA
jgi:acetyl esterase